MKFRLNLGSLATALACFVSLAAQAVAQSGSEDLTYFGTLGQGNIAVTGTQAVRNNSCVPTATANAMSFVENYYNFALDLPSPFTASPNNYGTVNGLKTAMGTTADGSTTNGQFNGATSYIAPGGTNPAPGLRIFGEYSPATPAGWLDGAFNAGVSITNVTPNAQYLADALNSNDGVTLGIQWGSITDNAFTPSRGGHEVTLQSINLGGNGFGTISFVDPWGISATSNASSSATTVNATLQLLNGFLVMTYPLDFVGPDDTSGNAIGANNGQIARILDVMVIAPVPEPSTYALAIVSMVSLVGANLWRRTRRAA